MHAIILAGLVSILGCANGPFGWWNRKAAAESPMAAPYAPPTYAPTPGDANYPPAQREAAAPTNSASNPANNFAVDSPNDPANQGGPAGPNPTLSDPAFRTVSNSTPITAGDSEQFEPARVLARVGDEVILAGDVMGPVNQAMAPSLAKMTKEDIESHKDEIAAQRERLVQLYLKNVVETKLMYLAFIRNAPIPADKRDEALTKIWEQVHQRFDEDELPKAMERAKVDTPAALDAKLREYGWSIAKQRKSFGEKQLGQTGALQKIPREPEVTHQEMLSYYSEHVPDYQVAPQARWEQLTVRFDRVVDRQAAYDQIARMGNEVALGGTPLEAVARRDSHDINAQKGGQYDWTNQGSLASKPLDEAIFSLPLNQLSEIIADDNGLHIVRVLERHGETRVPFTEAQVEIRKKLQQEKRQAAFKKYADELRKDIPVWTIYDTDGKSL